MSNVPSCMLGRHRGRFRTVRDYYYDFWLCAVPAVCRVARVERRGVWEEQCSSAARCLQAMLPLRRSVRLLRLGVQRWRGLWCVACWMMSDGALPHLLAAPQATDASGRHGKKKTARASAAGAVVVGAAGGADASGGGGAAAAAAVETGPVLLSKPSGLFVYCNSCK